MTVLLTGASGFVGGRVLQALRQHAVPVRAVVRRAGTAPGTDEFVADLRTIDWNRALTGVTRVVHLAGYAHVPQGRADATECWAVNYSATQRLAQAAAETGVERFVFLSTIKVFGRADHYRPLRRSDIALPIDDYGRSKLAAERAVGDLLGDTATVVRCPLVYGPGVRANFRALLALADSPLPLPFAQASAPRSFVYVDNLAAALVNAVLNDSEYALLHVADRESTCVADLLVRMRRALNRPDRLFSAPELAMRLIRRVGFLDRKLAPLLDPLSFDRRDMQQQWAWSAPISMDEGLLRTCIWNRESS